MAALTFGISDKGRRVVVVGLTCAAILAMVPTAVRSQTVKTHEAATKVLTLEKINYSHGSVAGELINRTPHGVRDAQLLIRYTWLWDDEKKPGKTDPSCSTYFTLPKELAPGARMPFTFQPAPPLANPGRGHYEISVSIAGFTEVIPQGK